MQYIVGLLSFLACTFLAIVDEAKDSLLSDAGGGQRACFVRYAEGEWGAVHISTVASIAGRGVVQQILASRSLLDWPSRCLLWMKSKQDPRSPELACQLKLKVHAPESSQPKYSARRPRFSRCHTVELLAFALHPKKGQGGAVPFVPSRYSNKQQTQGEHSLFVSWFFQVGDGLNFHWIHFAWRR